MNRKPGDILATTILHAAVTALAVLTLLPAAWMVWASLQPAAPASSQSETNAGPLTLDNYAHVLSQQPILDWLANSLLLASLHTILVVTLSSLGGFALAKYRFAGRRPLMLIMVLTMLVPAQVLLPSSYELMVAFGWIDSYRALIVPSAVSVLGLLLFRQAMLSVPDELLQAARVDGCSELRLWWDVAMPIVRPMTAAFTLLSFLGAWNSFLWPQIILQSEHRFTLPIGLAGMVQTAQAQGDPGAIMAATVLSVLPVVVLFLALQRDFISGLTSGAIRG